MTIELPGPLNNINIAGKVVQGELTITRYEIRTRFVPKLMFHSAEMQSFFHSSIDGVIQLIHGQLQSIEKMGRRLRVRSFRLAALTGANYIEHISYWGLCRVFVSAGRAPKVLEKTKG